MVMLTNTLAYHCNDAPSKVPVIYRYLQHSQHNNKVCTKASDQNSNMGARHAALPQRTQNTRPSSRTMSLNISWTIANTDSRF